jgi:DNA-binding winged helix-turn-helix (wHTH) protein
MIINDRFDVDTLRNEVIDKQTDKVNRVEPRLIKLLCLLTEYEGEAVSRKMIIKEIWNDYPGGDEGLNQAISVLRKLLNDDKKSIIETLPKTGYCFHGTIGSGQIVLKRKSFKIISVSAALFLLLIVAFVLGYYNHGANDRIVPGKLSREESIKAAKLDSKESKQLQGTDDQKRKAAGEADSRRK